jgi:hypothetical protein
MSVRLMQLGAIAVGPKADTSRYALDLSLGAVPATYDFDDTHPGIQMSEFLNDQCGDCVIAARANHTLRLAYRPGFQISDDEVRNEYQAESQRNWRWLWTRRGGIDTESSLEQWRDRGWTAGGIPNRKIAAFSVVDHNDSVAMKNAIYTKTGVQFALNLPKGLSATNACGPGHPWNQSGLPIEGGHTILLCGYDADGPIGITFGVKQNLSWPFVQEYGLAAYAISAGPQT